MNSLAPATDASTCLTIELAGETAVCDWRGVLMFPALDLLVVSDLHLEKGAAFARRGSFLPPYDTAATLRRLGAVIADHDPGIVISLGDSFHDGDGAAEMPETFRDHLVTLMAGRDWHWIAGNHDPAPPPGLPGRTAQEIAIDGLTFRHEPAPGAAPGEIAGHLHPGARIVRRGRSVRRACFASDGARLIMPAFGSLTGTLNVLDRAFAGLFTRERLTAYMLGRQGIYAIAGSLLR
ncbi:ligase-associated DNA damage response endonuclease PdeM [Nitratireductor sp. ZSWI3]|uniref:ligase-associated DNA damage response endonuclease PdeM n=1 Tax=Nitratireductor sp. ZSWI3 TaxID=2966359 RepID=UPI00214FA497|nr:ligase-associated DNA damage response endonuclease PdeM [Nitratireductor sp. ZSWI3]MCR4267469.1 ligase-associated DNA damage response endonuclease PdeM [Nitratireductor sp. ZSWI3]